MGAPYKTSDGAVFVQPSGANTRARYLGCADVDALTQPGGEMDTIIRCFKADGTGWRALDSTVTPPDPVSTTITTLIESTANWLEQVEQGEANIFIHQRNGGRADTFGNYDRTWVLQKVRIGEQTAENLAMREEDAPSTLAFSVSALPPAYKVFQKTAGRQAQSVATAINDVHFCGVGSQAGKIGVAVSDFITGPGKAQILYTWNGGSSWTATATQPFANSEDIRSATCFQIGKNTTRILVIRSTTDAANPPEIAYSDNWGASWTLNNLGTTVAQFAPQPDSLFALDPYNIWAVAGNGFIFYSNDAGQNWDVQENGGTTANALHAIHFSSERVGYAVGDSDTILKTEDGGETWTLTATNTGVSAILQTVYVIDTDHVWVGAANGRLWYTENGGVTWSERIFAGSAVGTINNIKFLPGSSLFGFMAHNNATPVGTIYFTIDGGYSWDPITLFTNTGINGIAVIDENTLFITGEAQGGTGVIGKVFAKP